MFHAAMPMFLSYLTVFSGGTLTFPLWGKGSRMIWHVSRSKRGTIRTGRLLFGEADILFFEKKEERSCDEMSLRAYLPPHIRKNQEKKKERPPVNLNVREPPLPPHTPEEDHMKRGYQLRSWKPRR